MKHIIVVPSSGSSGFGVPSGGGYGGVGGGGGGSGI